MTTTKKSATPLRWAGFALAALLAVMAQGPASAAPVGLEAQSPVEAWQAPAFHTSAVAEPTQNVPLLTSYDPDAGTWPMCYCAVLDNGTPIAVDVIDANAVPEPSSLALLGLGIAALRRRRT